MIPVSLTGIVRFYVLRFSSMFSDAVLWTCIAYANTRVSFRHVWNIMGDLTLLMEKYKKERLAGHKAE
jgi:hypothetical protein